MADIFDENDVPKYRKASQAKAPKKAKHKHLAEPCVTIYPKDWHTKEHLRSNEKHATIDYYCPICGKLMGLRDRERWYTTEPLRGLPFAGIRTVHTEECERELNPETRTLPSFEIDSPFDKFVSL